MRAESLRLLLVLLVLGLGLVGCASEPRPAPEPRLRVQAQEAEASGARRYAQGEYLAARQHFSEALRLRQSLDDGAGAARNRLQLAQAQLALGQPQPALDQASQVNAEGLQLQALLLQAQALLALERAPQAGAALAQVETLCVASCAERGRLLLLQARAAWMAGDAAAATARVTAALPLLRERGEEREVANAWRLLAVAQLGANDAAAALTAAQTALEMDRQHALPEKIARDWLLIGDIQRRAAPTQAGLAYGRAQSVAQAAGLKELVQLADRALKEVSP